jgi:phosphoribosylformylglycinamidine (FGAM) synthase-like amidotransferase family enzyme
MSVDGKDECLCINICVNIHVYTYVCVCILKQFSEFRDRSDTFTLGVCNGSQLMVRTDVCVYVPRYVYTYVYLCISVYTYIHVHMYTYIYVQLFQWSL